MVREFPTPEMVNESDLEGQLRNIITQDFYSDPFTLQDIADELGSEAFNPNERGKPSSSVDSDPQVSIKDTLSQMVREGYLTYNEEDETYEVSDDARMRLSA
jgi:hypothetical protein